MSRDTKTSIRLLPRPVLQLEAPNGFRVGPELAGLLLLVDKLGSIRRAASRLGLRYSTAWDLLRSAETGLGGPLVEASRGGRGGGGARLTGLGRLVLEEYLAFHRRLLGTEFEPVLAGPVEGGGDVLVYAGSHDPLAERALGALRRSGAVVEPVWTGSMAGALMILLGEADVAGVHLCVEGEGCNVAAYERLGLRGVALLVRGYERLVGLASRRPFRSVGEALDMILEGRLRVAWRQPGSGSRLLLESMLRDRSGQQYRAPAERWFPTHLAVAEAIARGEADVGLVHLSAARYYGLSFLPVRWERFDFLVRRGLRDPLRVIGMLLGEARALAGQLPGYRVPRGIGEVLAG